MTRLPIPWREGPLLRASELPALCRGLDHRTVERDLIPKLDVRTMGKVRFVTTDSFRRWLGEIEGAKVPEVVDMRSRVRARRMLG